MPIAFSSCLLHSTRLLQLLLLLVAVQPGRSAWIAGEVSRTPLLFSGATRLQRQSRLSSSSPWTKTTTTTTTTTTTRSHSTTLFQSSSKVYFERLVDLPPRGSQVQAKMKIEPILSVPSEIIEVRYLLPFNLNVEPRNNLAVCTKDGPGGEKNGDILRYASAWTLGLPQGEGLMASAAAFAGGVSWRCSLFDVMKAKSWTQVVEALTSNLPSRTDEVVLLFERPLSDDAN